MRRFALDRKRVTWPRVTAALVAGRGFLIGPALFGRRSSVWRHNLSVLCGPRLGHASLVGAFAQINALLHLCDCALCRLSESHRVLGIPQPGTCRYDDSEPVDHHVTEGIVHRRCVPLASEKHPQVRAVVFVKELPLKVVSPHLEYGGDRVYNLRRDPRSETPRSLYQPRLLCWDKWKYDLRVCQLFRFFSFNILLLCDTFVAVSSTPFLSPHTGAPACWP